MRFVPTPTASPQWRRDGCLVTAVARDNAAVPRSPLHRPYVSLNLRVAGQRTNALVGISFHRNQQQNRLADMLLLIGQKIGKMLPKYWGGRRVLRIRWFGIDHNGWNQIILSRFL